MPRSFVNAHMLQEHQRVPRILAQISLLIALYVSRDPIDQLNLRHYARAAVHLVDREPFSNYMSVKLLHANPLGLQHCVLVK
jgi:hypothetical protein